MAQKKFNTQCPVCGHISARIERRKEVIGIEAQIVLTVVCKKCKAEIDIKRKGLFLCELKEAVERHLKNTPDEQIVNGLIKVEYESNGESDE